MLSSAIIVFREALEAALVITIVLVATRGVLGRMRWVISGAVAGVVAALLVAGVAEKISQAFAGMGQELFNAGILLSAVLMLAWHNIWMSKHARELTTHLKQIGSGVSNGELPMYFLATAIGLAVLREGSEVVLFFYSLAASGSSILDLVGGGILGLLGAVVVSALLYLGLLNIPVNKLFSYSAVLILLLASGMAASAASFLMQAGILPELSPVWDSSHILAEQSMLGQLMHVLIGYQDSPTVINLVFYVATFCLIAFGMYSVQRKHLVLQPSAY